VQLCDLTNAVSLAKFQVDCNVQRVRALLRVSRRRAGELAVGTNVLNIRVGISAPPV
jgi:hypothetical protein